MGRKKVSIIGAGFVGSTTAHWLAVQPFADIALIDINGEMAKGKALDLYQATAIEGVDISIQGGSDEKLLQNSDLVVITAGSPRKEGMSRDDLLKINGRVVSQVCEQIKKYAPESIVIVVSNPLDAMTHQAKKTLGFPEKRVLGMAGILDTARFQAFVAEKLKVSVQNIQTLVLGGHGDTMAPVLSKTFVGSQLLKELLPEKTIQELVQRTKTGGGEIVKLLKTGSAYFAPARGVVEMITAIIQDQKKILPCTVFLQGEYGYRDIYIGVPCKLGAGGVEEIIEVPLTKEEKENFAKSVSAIKSNQTRLEELMK